MQYIAQLIVGGSTADCILPSKDRPFRANSGVLISTFTLAFLINLYRKQLPVETY